LGAGFEEIFERWVCIPAMLNMLERFKGLVPGTIASVIHPLQK
jgi:hypothetical protein